MGKHHPLFTQRQQGIYFYHSLPSSYSPSFPGKGLGVSESVGRMPSATTRVSGSESTQLTLSVRHKPCHFQIDALSPLNHRHIADPPPPMAPFWTRTCPASQHAEFASIHWGSPGQVLWLGCLPCGSPKKDICTGSEHLPPAESPRFPSTLLFIPTSSGRRGCRGRQDVQVLCDTELRSWPFLPHTPCYLIRSVRPPVPCPL